MVFAERMLADIQAVVFDLDGTLLDRRRSFERFVRHQWERLAHFLRTVEQEHYVQTLIELDRDGYAPRKELFAGTIAQFELPSGLVFVGDHPEVDVAGARAAGMQAIWRRDPSVSRMVEADAVIEELGDLLTLLGLERSGYPN